MVNRKRVVWDELARVALKDSYFYIKQDSPQQAEKVRLEILEAARKLADHPECFLQINIEKIRMNAFVLSKFTTIGYPTLLL